VGNGTPGYSGDGGSATSAQLSPAGVALDETGNIYVTDAGAKVIRKVAIATGKISTIAGDGVFGYAGNGTAATSAMLGDPQGIALDARRVTSTLGTQPITLCEKLLLPRE
jgi:Beta-propeller repeat